MSDIDSQIQNVNHRQAIATDPALSIWVSANAGSGKTYVLSRRVIRLLLEGNKPSELLCLTFTKAAAGEMSNRVFKILGEWAMMQDQELASAISELTGKAAIAKDVTRARKLFAIALDTPGGLRIQTIHAFCESLLHQFPLEANIPGQFSMMDDLDQKGLIEEARKNVILLSLGLLGKGTEKNEAQSNLSQDLHNAFSTMREHASDEEIEKAANQLIYDRDNFNEWIRRNGGDAKTAFAFAWETFDLSPDISLEALYGQFSDQSNYSVEDIKYLIELASKKTAPSYSTLINQLNFVSQCDEAKKQHKARCEIFLKQDLEKRKGLVVKSFLENEAHQQALFENEQALLLEQINRIKSLKVLQASQALFFAAEAILLEYARLKQKRGLLDFSDLISKTALLLGRSEISAWVQYKLDNGISHVLVDEAQDTSPLQWQIIEAITAEFYSGKGSKEKIRTVFVVGDEKQSIFSFQGADPKEFNKQFRNLMKKSNSARLGFERVPLSVSFRSTEEVLSAVDQVFSLPENAKGLNELEHGQTHSANRLTDRGEVILWPQELKPKPVNKTDWRTPPGDPSEAKAEIRLANKIALTIKNWISNGEKLPGRERPIRNGDILILVRKRDRFVSAINRALKQKGLISAGADRLKLTDHIAIEDMMAIGRFASMQLDDLALAGILKCPLFDFSEEEIFAVCHERNKSSLYSWLVSLSDDSNKNGLSDGLKVKIIEAVSILKMIRKEAARLPVFEFFATLFAKTNLRQKYHTRLGNEVVEVLDGFFQAAINYDDRNGLGLQGFIETLALVKPELKREIDMEADEIRVITAHSSKGLEAPIVFLVDPSSKAYETRHAPDVINYTTAEGRELYLWQAKKKDRVQETLETYNDLELAGEEEYRRLLYVAMTRAADRLIVCGYRSEGPPKHPHWHQMIEAGLSAPPSDVKMNGRLQDIYSADGELIGKEWLIDNLHYKTKALAKTVDAPKKEAAKIPDWAKAVGPEPTPPKPLSPSGVLEMLDISGADKNENLLDSNLALERGNAVHHLLQLLPDVEIAKRNSVMDAYFHASKIQFSETVKFEIAKMVTSLLDRSETNWLFSSDSKTEIEVSGKISIANKSHMIRGKIDRLIIDKDTITIADYKTNRNTPKLARDVAPEYLAQLALYRELVRNLYPHKKVTCILVWTQNASIMAIDDYLLDHQIERITNHTQQVVSTESLT